MYFLFIFYQFKGEVLYILSDASDADIIKFCILGMVILKMFQMIDSHEMNILLISAT